MAAAAGDAPKKLGVEAVPNGFPVEAPPPNSPPGVDAGADVPPNRLVEAVEVPPNKPGAEAAPVAGVPKRFGAAGAADDAPPKENAIAAGRPVVRCSKGETEACEEWIT